LTREKEGLEVEISNIKISYSEYNEQITVIKRRIETIEIEEIQKKKDHDEEIQKRKA
jgi:hypothetical protein